MPVRRRLRLGRRAGRRREGPASGGRPMADDEWWRTFFSGVAVEFWLKVPTEEQTRAEADFILRRLRLPSKGRVLDLACGGGRHAVELAARGYEVTGVDVSGEFLDAARQLAARRPA